MPQPSGTHVSANESPDALSILPITRAGDFPAFFSRQDFVDFLFEHLHPYGDPRTSIDKAIDYALSDDAGRGGLLLAALDGETPVGAMVVNDTGMDEYIPEHILVYVAVDAAHRGRGIGTRLMQALQAHCPGDIALHVEYDNPARRLYERLGFTSKYAEMRLTQK